MEPHRRPHAQPHGEPAPSSEVRLQLLEQAEPARVVSFELPAESEAAFDVAELNLNRYASRWLESLPSRLRPKTVRSYRDLYRIHLGPALGTIRFAELKRLQVKTLLVEKRKSGLSSNTVRLIGSCLSAMCAEAVDDGLLSFNPALALGRWVGCRAEGNHGYGLGDKLRPFTADELAKLLRTARLMCPRYYPLFLTLARTGCRPGEALVLRWSDVNFEQREIFIERTISDGHIGPTKTGRSRRVDMSKELVATLVRLRNKAKHRNPSGWVFVNRRGQLINEDWPRRVFAKAAVRVKLPGHTLYDLRHTFATLHLSKGHPITYVAAQLGHSDPSTTLRWYAHWLPSADKRFADALDEPMANTPLRRLGRKLRSRSSL